MKNKNTYAIGSNGPVMFNGTAFKSQKQLNIALSITFAIAGIIPYLYGLKWIAWIMWIFGILGLIVSIAGKATK